MIPFSVLDLAPIVREGSAADAFRNTLDLARHGERWGYRRYWLAEHRNMPGVASAAAAVVVGFVGGAGLKVPIQLLGSSSYSGQLAAALGLPFAFASHFAPDHLLPALEIYRREFRPSDSLTQPYAMAGLSVFAAETDGEAGRLFTSLQQQFANLKRGRPSQLQPPVDSMEGRWTPAEQALVEHSLTYAIVGSPETVGRGLASFIARTGADELMVTAQIFNHAARLRSYEIVAEVGSRSRPPDGSQ